MSGLNCCVKWADAKRLRSGLPRNVFPVDQSEVNAGNDNHQSGVEWDQFPLELLNGECEAVAQGEQETWIMRASFRDSNDCLFLEDDLGGNVQTAAFSAKIIVCAPNAQLKLHGIGNVEMFRRQRDVLIVWLDGQIVLYGQSFAQHVFCQSREAEVCNVIDLEEGEHLIEVLITTGDQFQNKSIFWELRLTLACGIDLDCGGLPDGIDEGLISDPEGGFHQPGIPGPGGDPNDGDPEAPPEEPPPPGPAEKCLCICNAPTLLASVAGYPAGVIDCRDANGDGFVYHNLAQLNADYVLNWNADLGIYELELGDEEFCENTAQGSPYTGLHLIDEYEDHVLIKKHFISAIRASVTCQDCGDGQYILGGHEPPWPSILWFETQPNRPLGDVAIDDFGPIGCSSEFVDAAHELNVSGGNFFHYDEADPMYSTCLDSPCGTVRKVKTNGIPLAGNLFWLLCDAQGRPVPTATIQPVGLTHEECV